MITVTLDDQLERQLTKIAHEQAVTTDEVVGKAIRSYLQTEASQILARESLAFRTMYKELTAQYFGQYVAVHHGQVVDHGPKLGELYTRMQERYPDEIILIKQVRPEIERVATVRSPRIAHD